MSTASRPDSPTYFSTHPKVDPDVGAALDLVLNYVISLCNSLDNDNIDGTPKIDVSKIDLSGSGFLPLAGGALSALLEHTFEGVWQKYRASGNGRIRVYNGNGATWGVCYNTEYNAGWSGRDVTDVCWRLEFRSDGLYTYWAVSAASGIAPTWTNPFLLGATGRMEAGTPRDGSVTIAHLGTYVADGSGGGSFTNATARSTAAASYTKLKETTWNGGPGQLRIAFDLDCDAAITIYAKIYRNGVAVGTERTTSDGVLANFSEDISGWVYGDLVQVYGYTTNAGWPVIVSNLVVSAGFTYGESTAGY